MRCHQVCRAGGGKALPLPALAGTGPRAAWLLQVCRRFHPAVPRLNPSRSSHHSHLRGGIGPGQLLRRQGGGGGVPLQQQRGRQRSTPPLRSAPWRCCCLHPAKRSRAPDLPPHLAPTQQRPAQLAQVLHGDFRRSSCRLPVLNAVQPSCADGGKSDAPGGSQPFRCPSRRPPFHRQIIFWRFLRLSAANCTASGIHPSLSHAPSKLHELTSVIGVALTETPSCPAQPAVICGTTMGVDEAAVKAAIKARKNYILSNLE